MKLILNYPCRPFYVHQSFGDNSACVHPDTKKVVTKVMGVCPVGYTDLYLFSGMKGHNGLDLYAPDGYPVYHCAPQGIVEEVVDEPARGKGLGIVSKDRFEFEDGDHFAKIRYWHLKSYIVKAGDTVLRGQLIGFADNTGYSSGSHLHLELKPVDKSPTGIFNVHQDNGYYGAIDPFQFMNGRYAEDEREPLFTKPMKLGETSEDVTLLQKFLQQKGYFPILQVPTGFYGAITRESVFKFQQDFVELNWYEKWVMKGERVGPKTLRALNLLR
jgi:hypothetical protein